MHTCCGYVIYYPNTSRTALGYYEYNRKSFITDNSGSSNWNNFYVKQWNNIVKQGLVNRSRHILTNEVTYMVRTSSLSSFSLVIW